MLARKSLLIFAGNVAGAVLGTASFFFIGRYMGPGPLGTISFAMALVGVGSFLGTFGFEAAHVKRVSEGRDLGTCLATFTWIRLVQALAFSLLAIGAALAIDRTVGFYEAPFIIIVVAIVYYAINSLRFIPQSTFDAKRLTARTQMLMLSEHATKAPLVVAAALLYGYLNGTWEPPPAVAGAFLRWVGPPDGASVPLGAMFLGVAYSAAMFSSLLVGVFLLHHHRYPFGRFSRPLAVDYAKFAWPLALSSVVAVLFGEVDKIMVGFFWSREDVGFYQAAQRFAFLFIVIPQALGVLLFPHFSDLLSRGRRDEVIETVWHAQRLTGLIIVPGTMLLIVYAREILHILASDVFLPAVPVLQWLALYLLFSALTVVPSALIIAYERPKAYARISIIGQLSNVVLNAVLIPASLVGIPLVGLKATGAALGTVASQVLTLGLTLVVTRQLTGRVLFDARLLKHAVAAVVTGGVLVLAKPLPPFFGVDRIWQLALGGVAGGLLYLALLWSVREVSKEDYRWFRDLVSVRQMATYVRDEVAAPRRR